MKTPATRGRRTPTRAPRQPASPRRSATPTSRPAQLCTATPTSMSPARTVTRRPPARLGHSSSDHFGVFRQQHGQPVDGNIGTAGPFQEHVTRNPAPLSALCLPARKHAASELFVMSDARPVQWPVRSRSASASRIKPSGSIAAVEYLARRCPVFTLTRQSTSPLDAHNTSTDWPRPSGASMAISPSGVGYISYLRSDHANICLNRPAAFRAATSDGAGKPSSLASSST